jgi:hypothetical protein
MRAPWHQDSVRCHSDNRASSNFAHDFRLRFVTCWLIVQTDSVLGIALSDRVTPGRASGLACSRQTGTGSRLLELKSRSAAGRALYTSIPLAVSSRKHPKTGPAIPSAHRCGVQSWRQLCDNVGAGSVMGTSDGMHWPAASAAFRRGW